MWKSLAALFLVTVLTLPARAESPNVVVSIQPLHSLVAGVMKGVGEPGLIVSGAASEHTYALKPSDARMLGEARMVVLVDEAFETFLAKPLKQIKKKAEIVAMADLPGMRVLKVREGGVWESHEPDHGHKHVHKHDGADMDGHVWLDPSNAKVFVAAITDRLSKLDEANAATYRANAQDVTARLESLDAELKARLAPLAGTSYVVFHDAYQYFETAYGLSPAGSITIDPDHQPSAKRLAALRDRLKASGAGCVFREPQFAAPIVETLAQSAGARVGLLDPQGAAIPAGPDHYFILMTALADSLTECLSAKG